MLLLFFVCFVFVSFFLLSLYLFFLLLLFSLCFWFRSCPRGAAAWLLVLLPVGIDAGFPAQRQGTLPAVHSGGLQDLVWGEKGRRHPSLSRPVPVLGCPSSANRGAACHEALADVTEGGGAHPLEPVRCSPWHIAPVGEIRQPPPNPCIFFSWSLALQQPRHCG